MVGLFKYWTKEEIEYIKVNYQKSNLELAKELNRTYSGIDYIRQKYNLKLLERWNKEKVIQEIRKNYSDGIVKIKGHKLVNASRKYFGSWKNAIKESNVEIKKFGIENYINSTSIIMSKEKAYLLGVLVGDGYMTKSKTKYKHFLHRVSLKVKDKDFAETFANYGEMIYGIKPTIYHYKLYEVNFISKNIFLDIKKYGKFGTKEWRVPTDVKTKNEFKCMFLKGFFDSEGSVGYYEKYNLRALNCCSSNLVGLLEVQNLLTSLGITSKIKSGYSSPKSFKVILMHYLHIYGKENFKKYNQLIGFSIKRKQEKLKQLLQSYEDSSRWSINEENILKANYHNKINEIKQLLPNRTIVSIRTKRRKLNLYGNYKYWNENEINYITNNYDILTRKEFSEKLKRSLGSIDYKINEIKQKEILKRMNKNG